MYLVKEDSIFGKRISKNASNRIAPFSLIFSGNWKLIPYQIKRKQIIIKR